MRIQTGNHWNNDSTDDNLDPTNRTDLRENDALDNFPHSNVRMTIPLMGTHFIRAKSTMEEVTGQK